MFYNKIESNLLVLECESLHSDTCQSRLIGTKNDKCEIKVLKSLYGSNIREI